MRLILIRHGQTPANVIGSLDTAAPGPGLTEVGQREAEALVETLAGVPADVLYVSTLVRTHLTAAPFAAARGLSPRERSGLREIEAGYLEKKNDMPSARAYMEVVMSWVTGDLERRMPGAQSGAEVFGRFDEVVAEAEAAGHQNVVVVSHGAMIRSWVAARAHNIDPLFVRDTPLINTGVVVLDGETDGDWRVVSWEGSAVDGVNA